MNPSADSTKMVKIGQQRVEIPGFIGWIAQDADGAWWGYEVEPLQQHSGWYENEVGKCLKLTCTRANPDWRDTLRKIQPLPFYNYR